MPTIGDVARRAGVATSTVSNALSGNRAVHAATRERILAAAAELGYQPNATASNLRLGRTQTVGLSIPLDTPGITLWHGLYSQYIESLADMLNDHGYKLLLLVSRTPDAGDVIRVAQAGQVDGMILMQIRLQDPRLAGLQETRVPFVAIGRPADPRGLIWVDADLRHAAELAVQHLFDRGHRRIALLGNKPIFGYQYQALLGFRHAHRRRGLTLARDQILDVESPPDWHAGLASFRQSDQAPTALITTADIEALTALHVFADLGLRVPEDVAVLTLGGSVLTQLARPPITVVCGSAEESCRCSVDLLMDLIRGVRPARRQHLLPVSVTPRHSTDPPHWRVAQMSTA
jgi:DNA-binding LacI/PurR family transcriptional regulator